MRRIWILVLCLALTGTAPLSAQPPAVQHLMVVADARGYTASWEAPPGQALACLQRRSWPVEADAPLACTTAGVGWLEGGSRDINLQLRPGTQARLLVYDTDRTIIGMSQVITGVRYRTWWPWWE